jgi:hypothetical protein
MDPFIRSVRCSQRAAERSIDTDRKRIASGPAQPDVAYMELFFQRNAIVRERYSSPELRGGLRNFAPLATNLRQSGWRKKLREGWAEGAEWEEMDENLG